MITHLSDSEIECVLPEGANKLRLSTFSLLFGKKCQHINFDREGNYIYNLFALPIGTWQIVAQVGNVVRLKKGVRNVV